MARKRYPPSCIASVLIRIAGWEGRFVVIRFLDQVCFTGVEARSATISVSFLMLAFLTDGGLGWTLARGIIDEALRWLEHLCRSNAW